MSGRTGPVGDAWARIPERVRVLALPVTVLLLVFYPNYYQDLFSALGGGTTGQLAPTVPTMVVMCVYVTMALGLNVVVGYAGLLDLGYVAFYAAGAYIAGWFATLQFAPRKVHFLSVGVHPVLPGLHVNVWLLLAVGSGLRHDPRHHHRPSHPAVAGRLPGDRDARVRRDHPAGGEQRRRLVRPQRHERAERLDADRLARLRRLDPQRGVVPPGQLPPRGQLGRLLLLDGLGTGAVHAVLLHPASRLAARPGLGGDPRGRDRGRGDGRPADAHEDMGVRHRGVLRRHGRVLLRDLQELDLPAGLLAQHLDRGAVHGDPRRDGERLGGLPGRRRALVPELPGARGARQQPEPGRGDELQHPSVHVRHLRHHHRDDDAGEAPGADTHRTTEDRAGGRRRGRIALRRRRRDGRGPADGPSGAQGVRRPRRLLRRRLHRSRRAASSA